MEAGMAEPNAAGSAIDEPGIYRIRVRGRLSKSWVDSMWANMSLTVYTTAPEPESVLLGEVVDQACLLGIVNALYNTGYPVIALEQVKVDESLSQEE
jgi:hypothetical protein